MIYDCFSYAGEEDILEIRFNTLNPVVSKFLICECGLTQSLQKKPLYYEENKSRFKQFHNKIIHVVIPENECPKNQNSLWDMEHFQRNYIQKSLKYIAKSNDVILVSDADELPNPEVVKTIPNLLDKTRAGYLTFEMDFYIYFFNLRSKNHNWKGTVAAKNKDIPSPQYLRDNKDNFLALPHAGWHYSWLCQGSAQAIHKKAMSCIEPFDKSKVASVEQIQAKLDLAKETQNFSFIHPENINQQGSKFEKVEITGPQYLLDNKEKYKHLFL